MRTNTWLCLDSNWLYGQPVGQNFPVSTCRALTPPNDTPLPVAAAAA